jgi:uncharacterized OB-fold protein
VNAHATGSTPSDGIATDGTLRVLGGEVSLVGGRCRCGVVTFPASSGCSRCGELELAEHVLARTGRLWSWTVQTFAPPSPPFEGDAGAFEPFGVGYVDLGDVIVQGRLTIAEPDELRVDMAMVLTTVAYASGRSTYAFAPMVEASP